MISRRTPHMFCSRGRFNNQATRPHSSIALLRSNINILTQNSKKKTGKSSQYQHDPKQKRNVQVLTLYSGCWDILRGKNKVLQSVQPSEKCRVLTFFCSPVLNKKPRNHEFEVLWIQNVYLFHSSAPVLGPGRERKSQAEVDIISATH